MEWNVVNNSGDTMYFTIGGHPGFNVPILQGSKQTDYYLLFKEGPALKYKLVYGDSGTADAASGRGGRILQMPHYRSYV